jgi:hypothetical protein
MEKAMSSRKLRFVVVTVPLALGLVLVGCKRESKSDSLPPRTFSAAKSPQAVTCPKGTPSIRVKDAQTLEFECPGGAIPKVEEVAAK